MANQNETETKFKYAYFFTVGSKIVWSSENNQRLLTIRFPKGNPYHDEVKGFIEWAKPGDFITVGSEVLVRTTF